MVIFILQVKAKKLNPEALKEYLLECTAYILNRFVSFVL